MGNVQLSIPQLTSWIRDIKADAAEGMVSRTVSSCTRIYNDYSTNFWGTRTVSISTTHSKKSEKDEKKQKADRAAHTAIAVGAMAALSATFLSVLTYKTYSNLAHAKYMLNKINRGDHPFSDETITANLQELAKRDYKVKRLQATTHTAYLASAITALAGSILLHVKQESETGRNVGYSVLGAAALGTVASMALHAINNSAIHCHQTQILGNQECWGLADRLLLVLDPHGVKQYMQKLMLLIESLFSFLQRSPTQL